MTGIIFAGCSPKERYDRKLEKELASGVRHDSIFMGLYLGMADKDFYSHCWQLNRQGLIRQGSSNMTVEKVLDKELAHPATMNFYPEFGSGKIIQMPVRFAYNGWSPWNEELSTEKLREDVLRWFKSHYGRGFIDVEHPDRGLAHVKIDGNRRITIYQDGEVYVWAVFSDMTVMNNLDDMMPDSGE